MIRDGTSSSVRRRSDCRLCGSRKIGLVVSLGETPLANEFVTAQERDKPQERFPLDVYICFDCGHLQLCDVVDPERLFHNYIYVSSTSSVFVEHFRSYAEEMLRKAAMAAGSQVLEIGSNDGTFLAFFKKAGMRVLGVDPAADIARKATEAGIETVPEFFDLSLARKLRSDGWVPQLIAANNVFAHADDLHGMLDAVTHMLAPEGLFVFEVSYLVDVFEKTLFDTIYHEHLSYHTVKPLVGLFKRHGMVLVDAIRVDSHGGSLRGIAKREGGRWPMQSSVGAMIELEGALGLQSGEAYQKFFKRIEGLKEALLELLRELKNGGKKIVGFGAPAKATTLMFHFGIGADLLEYIVDDSPLKQGRFSPGHHIPVVPSSCLYEEATRPDYALILAWNFAESIIKNHRQYLAAGGHFIIPLPELRVI